MSLEVSEEERAPREILKQQDNQTCLTCCLLMNYRDLTGEDIDSKKLERKLYEKAFGLYPESFVLAHLAAFIRHFEDIKATLWVDFPEYAEELSKKNQEERIDIRHQQIDAQWIRERLETGLPLLVYVDAIYFWRPVRMPHFLYVVSYQPEEGFSIIDTGYGKEFNKIKKERLANGISGLEQMQWSPVAITLENIESAG